MFSDMFTGLGNSQLCYYSFAWPNHATLLMEQGHKFKQNLFNKGSLFGPVGKGPNRSFSSMRISCQETAKRHEREWRRCIQRQVLHNRTSISLRTHVVIPRLAFGGKALEISALGKKMPCQVSITTTAKRHLARSVPISFAFIAYVLAMYV